MRRLTNEDITKNNVDTISQYKVLEYIKKCLDITAIKINGIKTKRIIVRIFGIFSFFIHPPF